MRTKICTDGFSIVARYTFACVIFICALSYQTIAQINPLLADADKITPFGNCDLVPTKLNPDYKLTVNNISQDKAEITSYKINWGDGSSDEIFPSDFSSATHIYKSLGIFNLVFTVWDINGITKSKTYSVSNQSNPSFGLSNNGGNTIGCSPLTLSFTITGAGDNAPGTYYEIDYGDGTPKEIKTLDQMISNSRIEHTYLKSSCEPPAKNGQFVLKVKVINSCTSTEGSIDKIIVYKAPIANFSTSVNENACLNLPIAFINQTTSGTGYNCSSGSDNYLWDFGDGKTSSEKNPKHQYAETGLFQVTLTSSNPQCQLGTTTTPHPICINPQPIASFALSSAKVCKTTPVIVTNSSTTSDPCGNLQNTWTVDNYVGSKDCLPNTSSWHFDTGSDLHSVNPAFIFDNAGSYRINLKVSNGCGTTTPSSKNITVKQIPTIKINPVNLACVDQAILPTAQINNCFGETVNSYSWQFAGGEPSASTGNNPGQVIYKNPGSYQILLAATNECGISTALPVTFQVNDYPKPLINGPEVVCANSKGNVYTTLPGMINYQWSVSAGGVITSGNTSSSNSITVDWKSSDNQTVSLNYSQFGCPAPTPTILNVRVNPLPEAFAGIPVTVCSGEPVLIGASAKVGSSYSWVSTPAGFVSTTSAPTVNPLLTTEYTLTETNILTGCSVSNSVKITVNPLPIPLIDGPAAVCIGSKDVVYTAEPGMKNYEWIVSPGGIVTAGGTSNSNKVSVTWSESDNLFISLNYKNDKGCSAILPLVFPVRINSSQTVSLVGPVTACVQSAGIIYTALSGMKNYDWKISSDGNVISGGDATSNIAEIVWNKAGKQSVSVNYTQPGCQTAVPAVVDVNVNARTIPVITGVGEVCIGTKNVIYKTEPGMSNYKWEISEGGVISTGSATNEIAVNWNGFGNQYVKVNFDGANLCSSAVPTVFNVIVNKLQIPVIKGAASTCQGLNAVEYSTESGMNNYLWKVSAGGIISAGTGTNSIFVVWNNFGEQSVSVSYSNISGCSSTDEVKFPVKVNPAPVVTIESGTQEICSGSLTGIKLSPSDGTVIYKWSAETISGTVTGAGSGSGSTIAQQLINTATSIGIVRYTITSSNGTCSGSPVLVEVKVRNLSPAILGMNNACAKSKGVTYTTEPEMTGYNWVVSSGGAITGGIGTNSITVDWNIVGNQSVSVSYGDKAGCTGNSTAVYSVKVNPLPTITMASPAVVCAGSPVTFTTTEGMSNYQWIAKEGTMVSKVGNVSNSVTVLWAERGSHMLTLNYTNSNGCSASSPLISEIEVLLVPLPIVTGPQNVCANAGNILYSTQPGKVNYIWIIAGGKITSGGKSTSSSATVIWENSGVHSISVNYSNGECMAPIPVTLTVNVNTAPIFTVSNASGCTPLTVTFKNLTAPGAESFTYDFNDGTKYTTTSADEEVTHTFKNGLAVVKNFAVKLTSSSESGCTMTSEKAITVEPGYSVGYPVSQKGCSPYEVKFSNAYSGSISYNWQMENGNALSTDINPLLKFKATDNKITTYTVRLIGESLKGCKDTVSNTITVLPLPKAEFTPSVSEGCSPMIVNFKNISSNEAKTYLWDFGNGIANVSLTNPNYTFIAQNGKVELFNVNLMARNELGCTDTFKSVIKVLPTPQPDFSVEPLSQISKERKVKITNVTEFGPWNYTWQFGDQSPIQTGNISEYEYLKTGYYTISLIAKGGICASTKKVGVTINAGPPTTAFECDTVGCAPFSVKFSNNSANGFKFVWDFGNGDHSSDFEPKITYNTGGIYKVRLEVYNNIGDKSYYEKFITVHNQPVAFFRAVVNRVQIPGNSVSFENLSENANKLLWDFGDGSASTDFEPQYQYLKTGVFDVALTVTTAENCSDKFVLSKGIEIYSNEMKLANAFIPSKDGSSGGNYIDGDPRNNIFHPNLASGDVSQFQFQIFNRWGNLFFQSNEVGRGWDGYFNGKLCPQDVYVWKIRVKMTNGELITKVGDVALIQ